MADLDSRPAPTLYTEGVARLNMFGMETINLAMFRLSNGRIGGSIWGTPVILLEASGRRTARRIVKPLLALPDGDSWVLAASRGGMSSNPDWFGNLVAYRRQIETGTAATESGEPLLPPVVTSEGGSRTEVVVEVLEGEQREAWWARLVEVYPKFAAYQERVPERRIPVLRLSPRH